MKNKFCVKWTTSINPSLIAEMFFLEVVNKNCNTLSSVISMFRFFNMASILRKKYVLKYEHEPQVSPQTKDIRDTYYLGF